MIFRLHVLRRFVCALSVCILGVCTSLAEVTIRAGGSLSHPPFEFLDENGRPAGFNVEIFKALMDELGCRYEIRLDQWSRIVHGLNQGSVDVVMGVPVLPEYATIMRFTMPTCRMDRNFVTRKEDGLRSMAELTGRRVVVEPESWFHKHLIESGMVVEIIENGSVIESLRMLAAGQCDAVLTSELMAHYAIRKNGLTGLRVGLIGVELQSYAMGVASDNETLHDQINGALHRIKSSGVYDQIYSKWFGIYEKQNYRQVVFVVVGVFLLVSGLLVAFVWLLRRKVKRATRMLNYSKQEVEIAIDAGRILVWSYALGSDRITPLHGKVFMDENLDVVSIYRRIHHSDAKFVRAAFSALSLASRMAVDVAFRIKDIELGEYRYFETKMVRVKATRELPDRVVGTLRELTQDVILKRDLEDYRIKTDFIVKTNDVTLIKYRRFSRTIERINSQDSDDLVIYTVDQYLAIIYPEDREVVREFLGKMDLGQELKIEAEYRLDITGTGYDWFSVAAAAFQYNEHGEITSYIGMRRNNTKWKNINEELVAMTEKAEASIRLKATFLANMSHEIRTPLNAIIGFSELMMDAANEQEQEQYMSIIRSNNDLLLRLVNDVLELSGIDSGGGIFARAPFDFSSYFDDICTSFRLKETSDVRFVVENKYHGLIVYSDQKRISQLMTNFVNNAFKFTDKGSITIGYEPYDNGLRVWVRDTGIGISPDDMSRVFRRFEKVNNFVQGTGLGLSICKEVIQALGGKIWVESKLGEGSTFWFWIPISIADDVL